MEIVRTEFRNPNGSIRDVDLKVREGLNDVENYQMPLDRLRSSGWFSPGIVDGLQVTARSGETTARVGPGSASDRNGNLVVISPGGAAIVDPSVDPLSPFNVPTVVVADDGVEIDTGEARGECWLTLTWREVVGSANPPVRRHAPWVRLLPAAQAAGNADLVPLAAVTLDEAGGVTTLASGPRRVAGARAGRLELRAPQGATGVLNERPVAELAASADGLGLQVYADDGTPRPGLRLDRASGDLVVEQRLRLLDRPGGSAGMSVSATDGTWRLSELSTNSDRLVIAPSGNAGIGPAATALATAGLHVAGLGVHTDGSGGGFSFADRGVAGFVGQPTKGERWVWYAFQGTGRLWSGGDKLTVDAQGNVGINLPPGLPAKRSLHVSGGIGGVHTEGGNGGFSFADRLRDPALGYVDSPGLGERWVWYCTDTAARLWSGRDRMIYYGNDRNLGLDVFRRVRVRQDGGDSAGIWFFQDAPQADRAFVGMKDDTHVGFWGNTGPGWKMWIDTTTGFTTFVGGVSKPGSEFRIDHPLDPPGSYLNHSVVESPERLNAYVGTVVTDERGTATIELPTYFAALNRDPRVQLTPIGTLARVAVCAPVEGNRVSIVADVPGVEIGWLVTGVRQDRWAERHPVVVEEPKTGPELGRYLHPEEHGQPAERGISHRSDPTKG